MTGSVFPFQVEATQTAAILPRASSAKDIFNGAVKNYRGDAGQMAMPVLYRDEQDYPAVFDLYTNRRHIEQGMSLLFLSPASPELVPIEVEKRWARMLTETNRDFQAVVLVPSITTAQTVAARLRNSGHVGVKHLNLQRLYKGVRSSLAPLTDPALVQRIDQIQKMHL